MQLAPTALGFLPPHHAHHGRLRFRDRFRHPRLVLLPHRAEPPPAGIPVYHSRDIRIFCTSATAPAPTHSQTPADEKSTTQITLALTPIVPIAGLVIYDFSLWVWRLTAASLSASSTARIAVAADLPKPLTDGISPDGSPEPDGPLEVEKRIEVGIPLGV